MGLSNQVQKLKLQRPGPAVNLFNMGKRNGYGQFCPISRAAELLTTRWTPLVVRELYFGSSRYSDLRRGLPRISSALLSQRLKELEHHGLVCCERAEDGSGPEYRLTEAGRSLFPVLESMGRWAQDHCRDDMTREENLDPDLLMWNIRRRVAGSSLMPAANFVVEFHFLGVPLQRSRFWLLFKDGDVEICIRPPGYEIGLTVTANIRTMTQIWLGHRRLDKALRAQDILLEGDKASTRDFSTWFPRSILAVPQY